MRTFVAVEVPPVEIEGHRTGTGSAGSHLTLLFLADVPEDRLDAVADVCRSVAATQGPFDVRLEGMGAFPDRERPGVVWVGIARPGADHLAALHDGLRAGVHPLGLPVDGRPFQPHLTLFRVRRPDQGPDVRALLDRHPREIFGRAEVRELLLKTSLLGANGATHTTRARAPLLGSPR